MDQANDDRKVDLNEDTLPILPEDRADPIQGLPTDAGDPTKIDIYEIRGKLGEGGFGVVYLAEQFEPVRRLVALKVIRFGMNTGPMLVRFHAERQALARLNHPGIAKIFDAGQSSDRTSWFAMEYVEGKPIDVFLDEHTLTIRQRIELMIKVCEAVQHAHSKGVIHRDLKPGNILVSQDGAECTPRVIDFGIAKAEEPLASHAAVTEEGQFLGTPGFMSPEQTGHGCGDVDARTDVYALGAIFYVLLCGSPHLSRKTLEKARSKGGFVEMTNVIQTHTALMPSAQLALLESDRLRTVAAVRGVEGRRLVRLIRGDLDWIAVKCLEVDRERRYATPEAIADDLRRHLKSIPISAGPPTTAYQLSKFIKRNKPLAVGTAAVIATLLVGLVVSLSLLTRAMRAEEAVGLERDTAFEMLGALTQGIRAADPSRQGEGASIGDLYRGLATMIEEGRLGNRPRDGAQLLLAFSLTSFNLNEYEDAARYAARILTYGDTIEPELLVEAKNRLALARLAMGETPDLAIMTSASMTPPELMQAQYVAYNLGDYDVAAWHLEAIVDHVDPTLEDNWDVYATACEFLARLLADQGGFEDAHLMLDEAARVREEFGNFKDDGLTQWDAGTLLARGALFRAEGRFSEAADVFEKALGMYQTLHGGAERFMVNLATAEAASARLDAAFLKGKEAEVSTERPGLGVMDIVLLRNRARVWDRLGRTAAADTLFALCLEVEGHLERGFQQPGHTRRIWAERLAARGAFVQAGVLVDEAIAEAQGARADLLMARARLRALEGRVDEAMVDADAALAVRRATLPVDAWPITIAEAEAQAVAGTVVVLEQASPGMAPALSRIQSINN